MDFAAKNYFSLKEIQIVLRAVMFSNDVGEKYSLILPQMVMIHLHYMSQLDSETPFRNYDTSQYCDAF